MVRLGTVVRLGVGNFGRASMNRKLCRLLLGAAPLADHHGVPWAGLASVVLANKSPLADHHGARAGLASPLGKLANLYLPFSLLCAWYLTVSVGNSAVLLRFTAFRADLRCTSGFMMVILMIWQTLAFCDPPACSALLDYTWISATTSSSERGGHIDVWRFGFGGLLRVLVVVFCGGFGGFGVCLLWFSHLLCFTSSVETHKNGLLRC